MNLTGLLRRPHDLVFGSLERAAGDWFLGLAARFVFAGVLLLYFLNSWATKVEGGITGFFMVRDSAYYQIVPWAVDAAGGDISAVSLFSHLLVHAGTYGEFILPVLIVLGLFTRVAALGMIVFVAVQSYVDVTFHGVSGDTLGSLFDRFSDSLVIDQRALWVFLLLYLVVKGAGLLSLAALLSRRFAAGSADLASVSGRAPRAAH